MTPEGTGVGGRSLTDSILEARKRKWVRFCDMSSPVNRMLIASWTRGVPQRPLLWWDRMREREEWAWRQYCMQMEYLDKVRDDSVPYLEIATGTEIFAEAFGCRVHRPEDNNPFALPLIRNAAEFAKVRMPRWEDTNLARLFELADRLKARAGQDALLKLPDIQSPMDIAALIWDKNDFYIAMFEEESAISDLAMMVRELLFSFLDAWFGRYGKELVAHYPFYYLPFGVTMSEDEVGIVSAEMFRKHYLGELKAFSERYGCIGIHCCADAEHQWENFLQIPDLKLLNLVQPPEVTKRAVRFFADRTAQFHFENTDVSALPERGRIHLVRTVTADTPEEAAELVTRLSERQIQSA